MTILLAVAIFAAFALPRIARWHARRRRQNELRRKYAERDTEMRQWNARLRSAR
jgi:hypothetical protein